MSVNTLSISGAKQLFTAGATPLSQEFQVAFVADVGGNTNSQFFLLSSNSTSYYVWNNVASSGVNPSIPNRTGIQVSYAANASAATIAAAMATAIGAVGGSGVFFTGASGGTLYVKNQSSSFPLIEPSAGNSLWTLSAIQIGTGNNNTASNGCAYLFTTPPTADYTYEVVVNTIFPTAVTTPFAATVAAPLIVGPNTPVYVPLTWNTSFSVPLQFTWHCNGYKIS